VSYARVIKRHPKGPLMPIVLRGVAKYAHQVNLELLLDLFGSLRSLLADTDALSTDDALMCVHALLRLLGGHGQALSVDTKDVQLRLYDLLQQPAVHSDSRLLATALDCLEHLCRHRSSLLASRVASFVLRLTDSALGAPHANAAALLCAASRLLAACPRASSILHGGEGGASSAASASFRRDPDSAESLRTVAWHLALLKRHYHPVVAELAALLSKQEPLPPRFVNATPLRVMATYSEASGDFNPRPPLPKAASSASSHPKAGRLSARSSIQGVVDAADAAMAAAGAPCAQTFLVMG